ncbi:MAG: hypothetical protein ACXWUP_10790 [Allosphingosinicella sp.]
MSGTDQAMNLLYLVLILVLVGSAFAVRRMPVAHGLKLAGAWILIFGAAFLVIYTFKDELRSIGIATDRGAMENKQ